MNTVNKLLDAARKVCDRDSDRAVAQRMKVSANSVFVWRKGGKITDAHLMALIDLAQADPALAVKVREEEAGSVVERKAWGALWDRLSPVTTVIGAMVLAIGMMPATGRTKTIEINSLHVPNAHSLYIMSGGCWHGLLRRSRRGGDHGPPHGVWRMRNKTLTGPWAGFSFQGGHLITPEGRSIAPSDLQWLSLTCTIAREWSTMMAEGRAKTPPKRPAGVIYLRDQFRKRQEKKASLHRVDTGPAAKCAGSSSMPARRRKGRV
ncbi:DUF3693 domain-containing protein [Xanthomonas vesicatoria]|uniref:DUF3693 domain-containing protein n=2 Tax=Xanthomonas vesicatoria TaxID=56460 RepID=UPI001F496045|nr:DUF3693 domain-containing protein [Xanthomonas vesicatoria]